ncbi:MAG: threonylcarbamoyl-AMP synthase [Clostridia bacterium]|nr:threonylcarbamoyl-AMP synthase [Clostridia bacterium]
MTSYFKMDINHIDNDIITKCSELLKRGKLVAFPTETVYGLGANGLDEKAIAGIFKAKGRPMDNPLILHVNSMDMVKKFTEEIPSVAYDLAKIFWPGPLTMIFRKNDLVPYAATANLDTVAIRIPSHKVALALITACGFPLAAPSANYSGKPSPTDSAHVYEDLNGKIDAIIDCGKSNIGIESTVLDITGDIPVVLRPGGVSIRQLELLIPNIISEKVTDSSAPKSPGMKYRHYSPEAPLYLVQGENEKVVSKISTLAGNNTGILCSLENMNRYHTGKRICLGSIANSEQLASNLFDSLRIFDKLQVDTIYSEYFEYGEYKEAIMNRLKKASSGTISVT